MNFKLLIISELLIVILLLVACENVSNSYDSNNNLTFIEARLGGCHGQDFPNLKYNISDEVDTVIFSFINDTLDIYVGLNYICCAPFISEAHILNDSILMNLNDTCSNVYQTCYCRCNCYYTWDFLFIDIQEKKYYYKIMLYDPREENPIIFREGMIDLGTIN